MPNSRGNNYRPFSVNKCDKPKSDASFLSAPCKLPQLAYLELTPACNNRCPGCSNDEFIADFNPRSLKSGFLRRPLNGEEWICILDRLDPSVTFINLTGGEPTLHPDFEAIADSINRRGIDFVVFTNGRWRNPEQLAKFLSSLSHLKGLLISLHGISPKTHEVFSGVSGSFSETVANIILAASAGLPVSISTVITHDNISELRALAELAYELGAEEAIFNRYLIPILREEQPIPGGKLKQMAPTQVELKEAVHVIEELRTSFSDVLRISYGPCIPQCFAPSSSRGCSAGENFLVVDPWGNVKPCTDTVLNCGNLLTQTIEEVWWSKEMQSWRELIPSGCTSCSALSKCRTGCRAMALASGLGQDPLMTAPLREQTSIFGETNSLLMLPLIAAIT